MEATMSGYIEQLHTRGHIMNLKGKPYVLLTGLLELAFENGLEGWDSTCVSHSGEKRSAAFKTIVKGERGTFTGHGDADPSNLSRGMLPSYFRMAETRSLCRALRFYLGIGMCARDELPGGVDDDSKAPPPPAPAMTPPKRKGVTMAEAVEFFDSIEGLGAALVHRYREATGQAPLQGLTDGQRQDVCSWLAYDGLERSIIKYLKKQTLKPEEVLAGVQGRLSDAVDSGQLTEQTSRMMRDVGKIDECTNISLMCAIYDQLQGAK